MSTSIHPEPEILVDQVSMRFESHGQSVTALESVSFAVAPGEFISLLGPSGCGKTTLLRLIADLLEPTGGRILISGTNPKEARLRRRYGIVFQQPVLYDWRTVRKNVELPLELLGTGRSERSRKAVELLALVGLERFADRYPWELSGGMQQRVAIARALALDPPILLMDEPFAALDEFTRERLQDELLQIWARTRKTVIFVTHSIPEAVYLSDRIIVLSPHPGRLNTIAEVPLPRPRSPQIREDPRFHQLVADIRRRFHHSVHDSA
ncbi:MAG: ABC transporter ATP-binding protein [Alicyclobacillaceae bacterium]|nr:ABC transporter ATP-binding protein [Alicyclobacillaceae bacterium]